MIALEQFNALVEEVRGTFFALRALSEDLHADLGCSPAERGVLDELDRRGSTAVPALARSRGITRQSMQKTIDRMHERGWVTTSPNPAHARSPLVGPTEAGRALHRTMRQREAAQFATAPLPVTAADLQQATETLALVRAFVAASPRPGTER